MAIFGNKNEFRANVDEIKKAINREFKSKKGLESDEWLRTLYNNYTERFLSDNERIWTTASIMIPLAFAVFVVLPQIQKPTNWQILILAIASISIITSWLFIAENHRAFQEKNRAWIVAIEETIGITNTGPTKIPVNLFSRLVTFRGAIHLMRWGIVAIIIISWVFVYLYWPK